MGKNFTTTIRLEGGGKNFQGKAPTLKDQIKEQGIDLEKFLKGEPQKEVFQTEGTNNNAELTSFVLENLDDFRNQKITAKKLWKGIDKNVTNCFLSEVQTGKTRP